MKNKSQKYLLALPAVALLAGSNLASAATLSFGSVTQIMNDNIDADGKADISVFDGSAGYQGTASLPSSPTSVSGTFGDGTVVDYNFFRSPANEAVSLALVSYASGSAGRIGGVTANSAGQVGGSQSLMKVWETTNDTGFTTTADFTSNTMAGLGLGSGTVDISNMTSGTIYFLSGGFGGNESFALTMTGSQPDILANNGNPFFARGNTVQLHEFTFDNADLDYDTINFTFDHGDDDGSAARFGGVILDGVPEPSTALLGALGALALLRRRR